MRPRNAVNSVNVTEVPKTDSAKPAPDVVQQIQSKLSILEYNVAALTSQLSDEKDARSVLQNIVKKFLTANSKEFECIEWPAVESNI